MNGIRRLYGLVALLCGLALTAPAWAVVGDASLQSGEGAVEGALLVFEDDLGEVGRGTTDANGNVSIEIDDRARGKDVTVVIVKDGVTERQQVHVPDRDRFSVGLALVSLIDRPGRYSGITGLMAGFRMGYGMGSFDASANNLTLNRFANDTADLDKFLFGPMVRYYFPPIAGGPNLGTGLRPFVQADANYISGASDNAIAGDGHPNNQDGIPDTFARIKEVWNASVTAGADIARVGAATVAGRVGLRLTSVKVTGTIDETSGGQLVNNFKKNELLIDPTLGAEVRVPLNRLMPNTGNIGNIGNVGNAIAELMFGIDVTRMGDIDFSGSSTSNFDYFFDIDGRWQVEFFVGGVVPL